jgi:hypothetical protein
MITMHGPRPGENSLVRHGPVQQVAVLSGICECAGTRGSARRGHGLVAGSDPVLRRPDVGTGVGADRVQRHSPASIQFVSDFGIRCRRRLGRPGDLL